MATKESLRRWEDAIRNVPPSIARRRFLQLSTSLAIAAFLPKQRRAIAAQPRFIDYPFKLGVSSGTPSANSVVLWTRLCPDPLHGGGMEDDAFIVRWEVATDDAFRRIVKKGDFHVAPDLAHSAHVTVDGLEPDRMYWYRFMAADAMSPTGCTRTFPAADAAPSLLRFASTSCQHYEQGYFHAYRHAIADAPHFMLFLGDSIYESSWGENLVRRHSGGVPRTLEEYRNRHAQYRNDADLAAAHAAFPWIVTVDDHEVENDWAGDVSQHFDPQFPLRRAAALQAFFEHMPLPMSTMKVGGSLNLYRRFDFGQLASLHVLDDRQFRDPQPCPKPGMSGANTVSDRECPQRWGPRNMLGTAQEQWLDASLAKQARWNILGEQTLVSPLNQPADGEDRYYTEPWDGYPQARQRLIDTLVKRHVANPVITGGDVHCTFAMDLHRNTRDPRSPVVATEFTGTSLTSAGLAQAKIDQFVAANPHCHLGNSEGHGYLLFDVTSDRTDVRVRTVESIKHADSPARTLAAFSVASGKPGMLRTT